MKISDLLEYGLFLGGVLTICVGLPQGLKNAVKHDHEKIYQRIPCHETRHIIFAR